MKRTLVIIDGHNFLFKAYGVPFKFHSKNGTPLHVVTTFLALVRRAASAGKCSDIAVVFDTDTKSSNHVLSKDYKANRKIDYSQDEDTPFLHMPQIRKVLAYIKVKTFEKKGVEADDIIASLATQYVNQYKGGSVLIASSDSDFYQLLSKDVAMVNFGKNGSNTLFTPKSLKEKYNITPKQYVLFKSLTGDTADNIKGVPGIGPVRASGIINRTISFDIKKYEELLVCNEKLVTLNRNIEVCKKWESLFLHERFEMKNPEIFLKLNF